jgi:hypothetical protein
MQSLKVIAATATLLAPAAAFAQPPALAAETPSAPAATEVSPVEVSPPGPALGDRAPVPEPAPGDKAQSKKTPVANTVGGLAGGTLGQVAGTVVGGPVGGIAAGLVGERLGSGAVSLARRAFGGDDKKDGTAAQESSAAPDRTARPAAYLPPEPPIRHGGHDPTIDDDPAQTTF